MRDLPQADTRGPGDEPPEGGEAVCWLDRVCPECGRLGDEDATLCARCGATLAAD